MNQPFEITENAKVRIAGVVIRDNAQTETGVSKLADSWTLTMTKDSRSGHFYASGFKLSP